MNKKLIICADDFGLTGSVNKSIIEVYKLGNLTHTSLMINMPGTREAFKLTKTYKKLNVGLHFNITEGKSKMGISSLTDNHGNFYSRSKILLKYIMGKINSKDIKNEIIFQCDEFKKNKTKLKYIDSHQHIHMLPFIFNSIIPIVKKKKLKLRLVSSQPRNNLLFINPIKTLKHFYVYIIAKKYQKHKVFRNDKITSIHHENLNNNFEYTSIIKKNYNKNERLELMIHPYKPANDLKKLYKNEYDKKSIFLKKCFNEYKILSKKSLFKNLTYHN